MSYNSAIKFLPVFSLDVYSVVIITTVLLLVGGYTIHHVKLCIRRQTFGPERERLLAAWEKQCVMISKDESSIREAILAAEEIFLAALDIRGFKGKTPTASLAAASRKYSGLRRVEGALEWAKRIKLDPTKKIAPKKAEEILKLYRSGLRNVGV